MSFGVSLLFALASVSTGGQNAKPPQPVGPSFPCTGRLTPTEVLICRDSELRAYDRAMAFAYSRKLRLDGRFNTQKEWLARRNGCGTNRICVLGAYKKWVDNLAFADLGPSLQRLGSPPSNGWDLFLGTLQSPKGYITPFGDYGKFYLHALGEDWYLLQADAVYSYDPHDGLGIKASTSSAVGLVRFRGNTGVFRADPLDPENCTIFFQKQKRSQWKLVENGRCGGIGSTLNGIYG